MMPKPLTKPQLYRLTLSAEAFELWCKTKHSIASIRPDGKWEVAITYGLLDQLQTAALPKENLSDTVLRIMAKG